MDDGMRAYIDRHTEILHLDKFITFKSLQFGTSIVFDTEWVIQTVFVHKTLDTTLKNLIELKQKSFFTLHTVNIYMSTVIKFDCFNTDLVAGFYFGI